MRLDHLSAHVDPVTRDELDRVAGQLEITADWLRNLIVVALNPPDLVAGLGPALAGLARSVFAGTPTDFTIVGPDHATLSVPAKETAYRVLREALVNIRKHARATVVTLRVEERDDVIVLALSDDGIGSNSLDAGPGRPGVATMRARAEAERRLPEYREHRGTWHRRDPDAAEAARPAQRLTRRPLRRCRRHRRPRARGDLQRRRSQGPHSIVLCDDQRELAKRSADDVRCAPVPGRRRGLRRGDLPAAGQGISPGRADHGFQHARRWPAAGQGRPRTSSGPAHHRVLRPAGRPGPGTRCWMRERISTS